MLIRLTQLYEIIGERISFDYSLGNDKLADIEGYYFSFPMTVKGELFNRAGIVMLNYNVQFTLNSNCDRCLISFNRVYSYDIEHILVRSSSNDNDDYIITESDELDLDELVIMDVLLQLPSKMLCKDDCIGLCPVCGNDLNYNECNCCS